MRYPAIPAFFLTLAHVLGCGYATDPEAEKRLNMPVIPEGFDAKSVAKVVCPINGSKMHIASRRELDKINDRIGNFKVRKFHDGEPYTEMLDALLIRDDGKIGYRFENNLPLLKADDALILDENFK